MSAIKNYIITLKESCSEADVSAVKSKVSELGGTIKDEFSLIKGFSVSLPESISHTLKGHEHVVNVEEDQEMKIN